VYIYTSYIRIYTSYTRIQLDCQPGSKYYTAVQEQQDHKFISC